MGWNEEGATSIVSIWPPVMWASRGPWAAGGGGGGGRTVVPAAPLGGGKTRSEQTDGGGFDVALAACNLAGETPAWIGFQPQRIVKQLRGIEECVSGKAA